MHDSLHSASLYLPQHLACDYGYATWRQPESPGVFFRVFSYHCADGNLAAAIHDGTVYTTVSSNIHFRKQD